MPSQIEQSPQQQIFQSIPWLRYTDEPRPYDGAPTSPGDSIFLGEGLPLLDTMVSFFENYNCKGKRDDQRGRANWLVHQMLMNPAEYPLPQVFDTCIALEETYPEHIHILRQDLPRSFIDQARATVDHANAQRQLPLLEIIAKNPAHAEQAKNVLRLWYGSANSQERIVQTMYNTLLAALTSEDPDIERLAAEITSFRTDMMPDSSKQASLYVSAAFAATDDVLAAHMAVDETIKFLRHVHLPQFDSPDDSIYHRVEVNDIITAAHLRSWKNPVRMQAIIDYYDYQEKLTLANPGGVATQDQRVALNQDYPRNIARQPSELRRLLSNRLVRFMAAENTELNTVSITLPDGTIQPIATHGDIGTTAMHLLSDILLDGHGVISDIHAAHDTLEYLGPPLLQQDAERVNILHEIRTQLKKDIWKNATYTVSPRGDRIPVDNPILQAMGMNEIVFHLGRTAMETRVTIIIEQYALPLTLDRHYNLRGMHGEELHLSRDARNWWEAILLSHLHPLVTGTGDAWVDEHRPRSGSRSRVHSDENITEARRGFRRRLPAGQCFTPEQAELVEEELFIDLLTYNLDRGLTRETGQYTWVLPKYENRTTTGMGEPMTVHIPHAADKVFTAMAMQ